MPLRSAPWFRLPKPQPMLRSTIKTAAISTVSYVLAVVIHQRTPIGSHDFALGVRFLLFQGVLVYFLQLRPYYRTQMTYAEASAERRAVAQAAARRQEFDSRLHRGLELADHEPEALAVVSRALGVVTADNPSELLLADSSHAHLSRMADHPAGGGPGCQVGSPNACAAVRRGQTAVFNSGDDLDACPHLRNRPGGDCSAVCVPVTILGNTVGVLHATGPTGQAPSADVVFGLETVANEAGARIGMIRALTRSQIQASTDPLTGLLNRRSLEDALRSAITDGRSYAVVMSDLDHFKLVNDTHGHDAGDRALRLFAGVLRRSLRPQDLACRYGGEEFVLVLPDCDAIEAEHVVERVRISLASALANGTTPAFTASFGIADSLSQGDDYDRLLTVADTALLDAKRAGRDRVVVAPG